MASVGLLGSATPSPFASMPQRAQVDGMNCIQPTAPAELGPRFLPKLVSTLLIAPSTSQGMPYVLPAACQMLRRAEKDMDPVCGAADVNAMGPAGVVVEKPRLLPVCGRTTRNVSAEAVLERASASTAPRMGTRRLMAPYWPATRSRGSASVSSAAGSGSSSGSGAGSEDGIPATVSSLSARSS